MGGQQAQLEGPLAQPGGTLINALWKTEGHRLCVFCRVKSEAEAPGPPGAHVRAPRTSLSGHISESWCGKDFGDPTCSSFMYTLDA